MRLKISGLCVLALVGLVAGAVFAGKGGGKGGGKPPSGPADPAIAFCKGPVYVANADGSEATSITSDKDGRTKAPTWSPDGSQIAFVRSGGGIYVVNSDGTAERQVLALSATIVGLAWSPGPTPDGSQKLAFCAWNGSTYYLDLYVVNLDGTGLVNLTSSVWTSERFPSWSPGADAIVVSQWHPKSVVVHRLGVINGTLEISSSEDLTATGPLSGGVLESSQDLPCKWANTQDLIALYVDGGSGQREAGGDLWIIPVSQPADAHAVLLDDTYIFAGPSWSPDDSQILYASWEPKAHPRGRNTKDQVLRVFTRATGASETILVVGEGMLGADWRRNP